jgi:hypothetical protein
MKNNKNIKLIITDWNENNLEKTEICFDNVGDAMKKVNFLKFNTLKEIKVKMYDGSKLIHSEFLSITKFEDRIKKGKKVLDRFADLGEECDETYA